MHVSTPEGQEKSEATLSLFDPKKLGEDPVRRVKISDQIEFSGDQKYYYIGEKTLLIYEDDSRYFFNIEGDQAVLFGK